MAHTSVTPIMIGNLNKMVNQILFALILMNVMRKLVLTTHVTSTPIDLIMTAHTFVSAIMVGNPIRMVNSILSVSILMYVMPASIMPVISTLPVLKMIDLMFVTVISVRSQIVTVNTILSVLTSTILMLTLVSHMLVTSVMHAPTTMVLKFISVMTAGSQSLTQ